ncbi:MAG: DUF4249 domain-containing protein [Crocinitomicaceae bacterium]
MKITAITISLLFTMALSITSCEKVIEIDLEDAEPQIVIESELKAGTNLFSVNVSMSGQYFGEGTSEPVNTASVSLSDNNGNNYQIPLIGNGLYGELITAEIGKTYTLSVNNNGENYTSTSTILPAIPIESTFYEYTDSSAFSEAGYTVFIRFDDPPNTANFYRVKHNVKSAQKFPILNLQITDDLLSDGMTNRIELNRSFDPGDTLGIELIQIEKPTYDYFSSLLDIVGGNQGPGGSAAPGNPLSSWSNNALGNFYATSSATAIVILP